MKKTNIGGQALIEGVMMRNEHVLALAVRDEAGNIRLETKRTKQKSSWWKKVPILRGVVAFVDSMISGVSLLFKSSDVFAEENNDTKADDKEQKGQGWFMFLTLVLSMGIALGLFFFLPNLLTGLIVDVFSSTLPSFVKNLIDGAIRLLIFVCYLLLVSKMKEIRRTFMYHGAEHKTINCYEHELPLTVKNVQSMSTVHDRCGTSFLFFVMFISILIFSLVGWSDNLFVRFALRIALLPAVAGVSYEVLKFLAKHESKFWAPFKAPGKWLQKLSTKEPDDQMVQVAITAFESVINMTEDKTIPEQKFPVVQKLAVVKQNLAEQFDQKGMDDLACIDWMLCEVTNLDRDQLKDNINITPFMQIKLENMTAKLFTGMPLQHILGKTEFFGREFLVSPDVLIPRFETELLVDKVLPYIEEQSKVLDLCCGSGAIGITIQKQKNCEVTLADISEKALAMAVKNAKHNQANCMSVQGDLFANISGQFDIIVSNPPYIATAEIANLDSNVKDFEPIEALDGGCDGLDFYRRILTDSKKHLVDGGVLALEMGFDQMQSVCDIAVQEGFAVMEQIKDYNGLDRIAILKFGG